MENSTNKEFTRLVSCPAHYADSSTEYVLPDYNGDVRKILFTSAEVHPASRFADGGRVELGGIVSYDVVYLDSEGELSSTSFTSEYDATVKCPRDDFGDVYDKTRLSGYTLRLVGPRKFSAKAVVAISALLACPETLSVEGDAFLADETPELLTSTVSMRDTRHSETVEREFAETLVRLDGAIADEVTVLYSGANATVKDISTTDGGAVIAGDIRLYALIANGDEPLRTAERTVPFDVRIADDTITESTRLIAETQIGSVTATVNPDENGVDVVMSAIVEFKLRSDFNNEVEVITDAYVVSTPSDNGYSTLNYCELLSVSTEMGEIPVTLTAEALETSGLRDVPLITATPKVESVASEGGCVVISGELRFSGIASAVDESGEITYVAIKETSPFTYSIPSPVALTEHTVATVELTSPEVLPMIDGDTLELVTRILCELVLTEPRELSYLSSMTLAEEGYEPTSGRVIVYYPDSGETLFDIARRFHTTPDRIARDNDLAVNTSAGDRSALAGITRLMIV